MKVLEKNRKVLVWTGMCPADENTKWWQKIAFKLIGFIIFASMVFDVVISVIFILENKSTDLEDCLFAIFQIILCCGTCYMIFFAYISRKDIASVINGLQKIYDSCK